MTEDTNDKYAALFNAKDLNEVAAAFDALVVEAQKNGFGPDGKVASAPPKKSGVWYSHNEQDTNGHTISVYALNMGGKTIAWLTADNDIAETDAALLAPLGNIPEFVTPHRITIWNGTRTESYASKGLALRYPQNSGVHIDTNTIRAYIMPRLPKIVGRLYGV